jgi:hypothetical protein
MIKGGAMMVTLGGVSRRDTLVVNLGGEDGFADCTCRIGLHGENQNETEKSQRLFHPECLSLGRSIASGSQSTTSLPTTVSREKRSC